MGVGEITGDWYEATEPVWSDEIQAGEVLYPWQAKISLNRVGAVDYKHLSAKLSFVENKKVFQVYLMGTPANFGRAIPPSDFNLIYEEMGKPPAAVEIKPPKAPKVTLPRPVKAITDLRKLPTHKELRDMIQEIGQLKGKISEVEYPLDDLLLDVAWIKTAGGKPGWVFEVQIGGNFYEALAKLKHAWDIWNSKPFLVTTEQYEKQAKWLLGGTFHELKADMRIVNYRKIVELHRALKQAAALEHTIQL